MKTMTSLITEALGTGTLPERSGPLTFACAGLNDCTASVARRGDRCQRCVEEMPRRTRATMIATARRSVSPDGSLDWCRPGDPSYVKATAKARAALSRVKPAERPGAEEFIDQAAWKRVNRGILLLGPTGLGKSKILASVALRILRDAEVMDPRTPEKHKTFRFMTSLRYVNGMALARAHREQRLGDVDVLFHMAREASLLFLDELGYEDDRIDPTLLRDLLRARYEPVYRPTIVASGATLEELHERYGEAAIRTIWERGKLIDLHPPRASALRAV